jgi:rod shape-determining protein MreC
MPLGTVDRTPPPFFKQGPSALSKLLVLSALSALLMTVDARRQWAEPVRQVVATVLYPLQWVALQPLHAVRWTGAYIGSLQVALKEAEVARAELVRQVQRAAIVEHLSQENRELRSLLGMRERMPTQAQGAQILYELPDPYTRRVVIDAGQRQGIQSGSAVMDGFGVLGQVTRVNLLTSEVTLLVDRQQAIPVINTRTGRRSLAFGLSERPVPLLELRFESVNTETEVGDVLTTSGIDGVYPPGLPVATVTHVTTTGAAGFARIEAAPTARIDNVLHVLVVAPATQPNPENDVELAR